jgi:glutamate/tyrosine decarboxylase-like PLP-dependent enzyme
VIPDESMDHPISLDPTDWQATRVQAHRMLDDVFDHLQSLRGQPVWQPPPQVARASLREPLPREPQALADVHQTFVESVLPHSSGNAHPGFMGWVQGGGNVAGVLAEMLAAGLNANLGGRDHMPIAVEQQMAAWTREMFGFPAGATGLFLTGSSQANFLAALVARTRALGAEARRDGLGDGGARLTAYASEGAHACIGRALDMMGLGREALRLVAADDRHRLTAPALRAAIAQDRLAGRRPFLVVGTAGSVDVGAIDDLPGLALVAREEGLHFHVDGALGALGVLSPAVAPKLAGLELADSVAFDWHKWGQVPYDAGYLLVRDGDLHRRTFATEAQYLQRAPRGLGAGDWWPCDYGPDLSRGFRALKVWFTLKTYGAQALGGVVERGCALAGRLAARIGAEPDLELLAPVALNIVCFRYRCDEPEAVNPEIVMRLHEGGRVAPSLTRLNGRAAIRAAIVNHRTDETDIEALVRAVLETGHQCCNKRAA